MQTDGIAGSIRSEFEQVAYPSPAPPLGLQFCFTLWMTYRALTAKKVPATLDALNLRQVVNASN